MNDAGKGIVAIVASSSIWGVSGIYFDALKHLHPLDVLTNRTVWSFVFFLILLAGQRRLRMAFAVFSQPRVMASIIFAACMVSANWLLFIIAIQTGHATQASLGYYIFPLIAAALGAIVLKEAIRPAQWMALVLAALAVTILTVGLGVFPWISMVLALTFALYGLGKKQLPIGPVLSVAIEVALVSPVLLMALYLTTGGTGAFGTGLGESAMLIGLVTFTAVPLIFFSYASKRLTYTTLGLVQYLNPTLQFLVAVFYLGEPVSTPHLIAFPLIWLGLAIFTYDAFRRERAARRASIVV